ncbi:MAG TPA: hypothetical protein VGN88_04590 [Phycisphaerae bacterium]
MINTPGAVQEHVLYTAYGITTFTNSSWSSSADTLAVRTGWQGGESMSWIVGWSFQNRIELANLNVWLTAEPSMGGYVDGMNLYDVDAPNPINRRDPSGNITVRTVNIFPGLTDGAFRVRWNFILDHPAPKGGGYIVQRVESWRNTDKRKAGTEDNGFGPMHQNPVVYWEAWYVKEGEKWPNHMFAPVLDGATDAAFLKGTAGVIGFQGQKGEARFYASCGVLGNHILYPSGAKTSEPDKNALGEGWGFNRSYFGILPGNITSTAQEPSFWSKPSENGEPPGFRSAQILWN